MGHPLQVIQPRTCGGCTLCCKVMGVKEINKPRDTWCSHTIRKSGCRIYADRPTSCQTFKCEWLKNVGLPEWARPDKVHGVMTDAGATKIGNSFALYEDPGWPGHASIVMRRPIQEFVQHKGSFVLVVTGDRHRFEAAPELVDRLSAERVDEHTFRINIAD